MLNKNQQPNAHYERGVVLEKAGHIAEAVEEYRQALQENPRLRAAHVALAKFYERNELLAKAADAWAAVVAIQADFVSLSQLATTQIELKRYAEARETLLELLRQIPDDPFVVYELAYIEYAEGQYQTALAHLIELRPMYNDEWQLHHLIGNCQIKLGLYDAAQASFGRAILLTSDDEHLEELQSSVAMIERLREFSVPRGRKDWAYTEHGIVYLGTMGDDGLDLAEITTFAWTYPALATTLRRAVLLAEANVWRCSAVLAINRDAEPLARVLAGILKQPLRQPRDLHPADVVLVVVGILSENALVPTIHEYVPCSVVTFALALRNQPNPGDTLPDIVGLQVRQTTPLPWADDLNRAVERNASAAVLDAATNHLEAALRDLPPEANAAAQVAYYAALHRRIELP